MLLARMKGKVTPAGWGVLSVFLFTAMIGLDTDSSIAFQASALLAAILLLSFLNSIVFRGSFAATRMVPRFGTVGEPLRYEVLLTNQGSRAQIGLTYHEAYGDPVARLEEKLRPLKPSRRRGSFRLLEPQPVVPKARFRPVEAPPVPAGETVSFPSELLPCKRGVLDLRSARVARPDPLGLFRAFKPVAGANTLLILPKRYRLPDLELPGREQYQLGGVTQASSVGRSEEFISLRDYRRGDPLRHIHWRSWAKTGEPIVKEFEDEFFVRHGLILDTFCDEETRDEVFEEAVSLAASFACSIGTQESLLDLMFVGDRAHIFTAGRGVARADQLLEVLAGAQPSGQQSFDSLTSLVLTHSRELSGCVLVLLAWDARRQDLVARLRQMGMPLRVFLIQEPGAQRVDPATTGLDRGHFRALEAGNLERGLMEG